MYKKYVIFYLFLFFMPPIILNAQKIGEKTNLFYGASTTPNIGIETSFSRRWTVDLLAGYNPWSFSGETSLRHWLVRAEPRFWLWTPFMGHFLGIHGMYARYNIGNLPFGGDLEKYTFKGDVFGGGFSYGYHFILKGRWGLELSFGLGYLKFSYDKFTCKDCRELQGSYTRNYIGPTRVGISLIYMLQ
ncbi:MULTISPECIES: DUF3575 domain-containing protein [unclassified Parabacteroides]|uniref:DUF3575 domain-containing protein n=1 Tax=unclassified Parabacteroides TaxID=2649774 RepID=UPI0021026184|nr:MULTISPECIES: DUF3575 domain-containing protein [unclassified Parabacteroides]